MVKILKNAVKRTKNTVKRTKHILEIRTRKSKRNKVLNSVNIYIYVYIYIYIYTRRSVGG